MKNWYIAITEENHSELLEWWNDSEGYSIGCRPPSVGEYLMSKNPKDNSCYWTKSDTDHHGLNWQQQYELITLEQFRQITNPLPEHWCIVATKENIEELNRWRLSKRTPEAARWDDRFVPGAALLSEHPQDDGSYFWAKAAPYSIEQKYPQYKPITIEQFRQITNPKPMSNTEVKSIQIPRTLLNEYYEAATTPQREYLTKHFKLDGTTTDEAIRGLYELACNKWKPKIKAYHWECFPEDSKYFDFSKHTNLHGCDSIVLGNVAESLGLCRNFIQVRFGSLENNDRSFYLTGDYNWELINEGGDMVLIPTKKVK
jgi:hypothetical protein